MDAAVTDAASQTVQILKGSGDGTFSRIGALDTGLYPFATVAADSTATEGPIWPSSVLAPRSIQIFPGRGDGTFGAPLPSMQGE